MRQWTFPGFIKYYIYDLTGSKSLNVHKLAKKLDNNRRLLEPLILYCLFFNKTEILKKYICQEYRKLVNEITIENAFDEKYKYEYCFLKVKTSYERRAKKYDYNKAIKTMIRENIKKEMEKKNLSIYFIYKSLHLNKGNVNAFISKGDVDKLSLETTHKIICFVREL